MINRVLFIALLFSGGLCFGADKKVYRLDYLMKEKIIATSQKEEDNYFKMISNEIVRNDIKKVPPDHWYFSLNLDTIRWTTLEDETIKLSGRVEEFSSIKDTTSDLRWRSSELFYVSCGGNMTEEQRLLKKRLDMAKGTEKNSLNKELVASQLNRDYGYKGAEESERVFFNHKSIKSLWEKYAEGKVNIQNMYLDVVIPLEFLLLCSQIELIMLKDEINEKNDKYNLKRLNSF